MRNRKELETITITNTRSPCYHFRILSFQTERKTIAITNTSSPFNHLIILSFTL